MSFDTTKRCMGKRSAKALLFALTRLEMSNWFTQFCSARLFALLKQQRIAWCCTCFKLCSQSRGLLPGPRGSLGRGRISKIIFIKISRLVRTLLSHMFCQLNSKCNDSNSVVIDSGKPQYISSVRKSITAQNFDQSNIKTTSGRYMRISGTSTAAFGENRSNYSVVSLYFFCFASSC